MAGKNNPGPIGRVAPRFDLFRQDQLAQTGCLQFVSQSVVVDFDCFVAPQNFGAADSGLGSVVPGGYDRCALKGWQWHRWVHEGHRLLNNAVMIMIRN